MHETRMIRKKKHVCGGVFPSKENDSALAKLLKALPEQSPKLKVKARREDVKSLTGLILWNFATAARGVLHKLADHLLRISDPVLRLQNNLAPGLKATRRESDDLEIYTSAKSDEERANPFWNVLCRQLSMRMLDQPKSIPWIPPLDVLKVQILNTSERQVLLLCSSVEQWKDFRLFYWTLRNSEMLGIQGWSSRDLVWSAQWGFSSPTGPQQICLQPSPLSLPDLLSTEQAFKAFEELLISEQELYDGLVRERAVMVSCWSPDQCIIWPCQSDPLPHKSPWTALAIFLQVSCELGQTLHFIVKISICIHWTYSCLKEIKWFHHVASLNNGAFH